MSTWQQQWRESVKTVDTLLSHLHLSPEALGVLSEYKAFPLRVPYSFVDRMEKSNPFDPLLLQVLPLEKELDLLPGYQSDPLQEKAFNPVPGLLHKYRGRVLLTLTGACAVHCRYCFRRHFPYDKNNPGTKGWAHIFNYLLEHLEVSEVILSGGDPLSLDDDLLEHFLTRLEEIATIKYLRFHTRLPVVLPDRVTQKLADILKSLRFRTTIVFHSNHPNEWTEVMRAPVQKLQQAGVILLNQAVLLKQVNDTVETLVALSYRLYDFGVLPYYLHLLDKVTGSAHFEVSETVAVTLMQAAMARLPGYLVPKLVREIPDSFSKVPIDLNI